MTTLPNPALVGTPSSAGNMDALLKDVYAPKIISLLNKKTALLDKLGKSGEKFSGRQLKFMILTGRENGVGNRGENAGLPRASVSRQVQASIVSKTLTGRIQASGETIEKSKTDKGAFAADMATQMDNIVEAIHNDLNRQLYGVDVTVTDAGGTDLSGKTGLFGYVTAGAASDIQAFSSTTNMVKGMSLAIGTATEFAAGSFSTGIIESVDSATQVTFESPITTVTNDGIARGDADGSAYNEELTGLVQIVKASGTFQDVSSTTYPNWKASVIDAASGYSLDDDRIQEMMDTVGDECGTEPNLIVTHRRQRKLYLATLLAGKRYMGQELKGGFSGKLVYQGGDSPVEIFVDKFCPNTKAFFLNVGDISMYTQQEFTWMEDGAIFSRVAGKFGFEASMTAMKQLGCKRRNSHGVYNALATS